MDGMEGTEGKACAMICGEPELLEQLMQSLLGMADVADEHGFPDEADALSSLIPDVKMMKAAQYEGFQNYWVANSRAFELSFKQRLEAQKEDEKSYQRAWMETLQDYMDSLLGPQTEFIGKYIKTAQYEGFQNYWLMNSRAFELAFKKKLETQSEKEKSFFKAWMEVLEDYQDCEDRQEFLQDALKKTASKTENDMAMVVLAEAERKKVTLADLYCEWADSHKTALSGILVLSAKKIEGGKLPAVAVYESLDYFSSGSHSRNTVRKIQSCANRIEEKLLKSAGFVDEIRKMWWNWKAAISDVWDKITFQSGVGASQINKITAMGNWFKKQYDKLKAQVAAGGAIDPAFMNHEIGPYIEELRNLVQLIQTPGSAARVAKMPELFIGGEPNPEYFDPELNGVGQQQFDDYMGKLADVLYQIRGAAQQYDKAAKEGIVGTNKPGGTGNFEIILSNALTVSTKLLAQELKKYSNTIPFDQMIQEVKSPPTPWPNLLEEAARNSGITQGRVESEGSITDATKDLTSSYMDIVNKYFNRLITEVSHSSMAPAQKTKIVQQIEAISKAHAASLGERINTLIMEKFNLAVEDV